MIEAKSIVTWTISSVSDASCYNTHNDLCSFHVKGFFVRGRIELPRRQHSKFTDQTSEGPGQTATSRKMLHRCQLHLK